MTATESNQDDLFDRGPPMRVQRAVGLLKHERRRLVLRAALVAAIGWLPLALLILIDGDTAQRSSFFSNYSVHARYIIAAPLLVLAEGFCVVQLGRITGHFVMSGIVPAAERARFDGAIASTRRLLDSPAAEISVVLLAYLAIGAVTTIIAAPAVPAWHTLGAVGSSNLGLAGWWHVLVSAPLLLVLLLGWLWRLLLWTRLLLLVSRLDLQLVAAHPDGAAGLAFVGLSVRAFSLLAMSFGTILAGQVTERIVHHGDPIQGYVWHLVGLLVLVAILFISPLLVFSGRLVTVWRRGVLDYGALATLVGRDFEKKWLRRKSDQEALDAPDFSATTDLYQVVSNVYRLRYVPVDMKSVFVLIGASLIPFGVSIFLILPFATIAQELGKLLF